jgi:hypothetical protein
MPIQAVGERGALEDQARHVARLERHEQPGDPLGDEQLACGVEAGPAQERLGHLVGHGACEGPATVQHVVEQAVHAVQAGLLEKRTCRELPRPHRRVAAQARREKGDHLCAACAADRAAREIG